MYVYFFIKQNRVIDQLANQKKISLTNSQDSLLKKESTQAKDEKEIKHNSLQKSMQKSQDSMQKNQASIQENQDLIQKNQDSIQKNQDSMHKNQDIMKKKALKKPPDYDDYWYTADDGLEYNEYDDDLEDGYYYEDDKNEQSTTSLLQKQDNKQESSDVNSKAPSVKGLPKPIDYEDYWYEGDDGYLYNEYDDELEEGQFYEDELSKTEEATSDKSESKLPLVKESQGPSAADTISEPVQLPSSTETKESSDDVIDKNATARMNPRQRWKWAFSMTKQVKPYCFLQKFAFHNSLPLSTLQGNHDRQAIRSPTNRPTNRRIWS